MATAPNNRTVAKLERLVFSSWSPWGTPLWISISQPPPPESCNKLQFVCKNVNFNCLTFSPFGKFDPLAYCFFHIKPFLSVLIFSWPELPRFSTAFLLSDDKQRQKKLNKYFLSKSLLFIHSEINFVPAREYLKNVHCFWLVLKSSTYKYLLVCFVKFHLNFLFFVVHRRERLAFEALDQR